MTTATERSRGSATLEYVAAIAVAAVLVVGLVLVAPGPRLAAMAAAAVCTVRTMAPCAVAAPPEAAVMPVGNPLPGPTQPTSQPTSAAPGGDTGDRRDQEREARGSRRGDSEDKALADPTVPGVPKPADALSDPVAGTSVPEPVPPVWSPVDAGAGEYDSERAWPWDHAKKFAAEVAANGMAATWPDAARNLAHYLGNTGEPLEQDVNRILNDVPAFRTETDQLADTLAQEAVERARESGATGPVTFPVNTKWQGYYIEGGNWFYALGGVSYNLTGQVTVYPPTSPGGAYTYEISTRVNLADQYNWDPGKSTRIGGVLPVSDATMARMHRQGLAREYRNQGRSDIKTTRGTVP